jgi:hypothetical protein
MIDLSRSIPAYAGIVKRFLKGEPDAVLLVEFAGDTLDVQQRKLRDLVALMGDLGLHVAHVPLRLGWIPRSVYARLDDVVTKRPGPDGTPVVCDTWDNALLTCTAHPERGRDFTMLWEPRRIAPGHANTWYFEAVGMDGGVRFSTREPATLRRFSVRDGEQVWEEVQPGNVSAWPVVSGAIFEFGFAL